MVWQNGILPFSYALLAKHYQIDFLMLPTFVLIDYNLYFDIVSPILCHILYNVMELDFLSERTFSTKAIGLVSSRCCTLLHSTGSSEPATNECTCKVYLPCRLNQQNFTTTKNYTTKVTLPMVQCTTQYGTYKSKAMYSIGYAR